MNIKIITYVDDKRIYEEIYVGEYIEEKNYEKINYYDKNQKKIEIFIDKTKESVSIEKDNSKIFIEYGRKANNYNTQYGVMKLDTQLVKLDKKSRRSLVMHEIVYNIYFDKNDKQQNKLKILVKKS